ncbi:hypothetical protein V6Z11_A02G144600 [Gossypium hirsutum]
MEIWSAFLSADAGRHGMAKPLMSLSMWGVKR